MKKLLLSVGIVITVAGVLSLLLAAMHLYGYCNVLDADADLYIGLHRKMIVGGFVLSTLGTAYIIISRLR